MSIIEPASREPVEIEERRSLSPKDKAYIAYDQDYCCAICDASLGDGFDIDHIVPLELGGEHLRPNFQALCVPCHKAKTREDIKRIRKAQRLERDSKPETRRKSPHRIRGRGFAKDPLR